MYAQMSESSRLSDTVRRALKPFIAVRKSFWKKSRDAQSAQESSGEPKKLSSSTDPTSKYGSTPSTSSSTVDVGSGFEVTADRLATSTCQSLVEEPIFVGGVTPSLLQQDSLDCAVSSSDIPLLQPSRRASAEPIASFFVDPRRRPLPSPAVSPRATSPAAPDGGHMTLAQAVNAIPVMASQTRSVRNQLKQEVEIHCTRVFPDAKVLSKALDSLTFVFITMKRKLGNPSQAHLDDIDLIDIHLGALLQEADRILRSMRPGKPRKAPLEGRTKSMKAYCIRKDLGPQMVELAQSLKSLEERAQGLVERIIAERADFSASPDEKERSGIIKKKIFFSRND